MHVFDLVADAHAGQRFEALEKSSDARGIAFVVGQDAAVDEDAVDILLADQVAQRADVMNDRGD
ncbi:MAG TPA: hypothetical protein VL282_12720 [Tepidisphaeraceae bacterium]|nr:hypothetical protein [Tepidisphaeraceae bacterium]